MPLVPAHVEKIRNSSKVGIFGGSFNPIHVGHLNCLWISHKELGLDQIALVLSNQTPGKMEVEGPSLQDRLEMLEVAASEFSEFCFVDGQEVARGGTSYTIDTIKEYRQHLGPEQIYLIIGMDQFLGFERWKDYRKILAECNLVVFMRPGFDTPTGVDALPEGLRELVAESEYGFFELTTGRNIEFIEGQPVQVSSSDVRKRIRTGKLVDRQLSHRVQKLIEERGWYAPLGPKIGDYETFLDFCAQALFAKKAIQVRGFDLRATEAATEFTLVASGTSTRQSMALADGIVQAVKEQFNVLPLSVEGMGEGRWIVLDYGALIVHVFYDFVRQEYRLEDLWRFGKEVQLVEKPSV